jgi:ATP-dependent protease HslVU (ClpYQ) ATPase subunit
MIRDLVDIAIDMVREERLDEVADRAELNAEDRLLDLLMPPQPEPSESVERTREKLRERLREGKLDERLVEIDVKDRGPTFEITTNRASRRWASTSRTCCPTCSARRRGSARCAWPRRSITWCRKKSRSSSTWTR